MIWAEKHIDEFITPTPDLVFDHRYAVMMYIIAVLEVYRHMDLPEASSRPCSPFTPPHLSVM